MSETPPPNADEQALDAFIGLVAPLLRALDALAFAARQFHPPNFAELTLALTGADGPLRDAQAQMEGWPERLAGVRGPLEAAAGETLAAFDGLALAFEQDDLSAGYRALRHLSRAQEALYVLHGVPPISRYFLEPEARFDEGLLARLAAAEPSDLTGVGHLDNERGMRGGFSIYVPEYYSADRDWPLVVALHGGSGHGRAFLWSWLRAARTLGAIVVAPTSVGPTWALAGPDEDTPNLLRILEMIGGRWRIDRQRLLLTGMSDGGTFSYVSGLEPGSPFTHLAPVSASFHPMLADYADEDRVKGLPIRIVHGALDWMFAVDIAEQAQRSLGRAGAEASLVVLDDLSHTYPIEQSAEILRWLQQDGPAA